MEQILIFKPDGTKTVRVGYLARALGMELPELKDQILHLFLKSVMKEAELPLKLIKIKLMVTACANYQILVHWAFN